MEKHKLRSRSYPAISLEEAVDLVRRAKEGFGWESQNRNELMQVLGHHGKSGAAMRKVAALVQFGILTIRKGLYSTTPLARRLQSAEGEAFEASLREACLQPGLFREILYQYDRIGKVPRPLAPALQEHGIQDNAKHEVSEIFMSSAVYAGLLDSDGRFRDAYYDETRRPRPRPEPSQSVPEIGQVPAEDSRSEASAGAQTLRFFVTDQKQVELHLPARLNEQDILLLRAQIDFLELQVKLNRPDQPVRLDVYRDRKRQ